MRPVSSERWRQIESLYHAALERDPESRPAFLLTACADDSELLKDVESLLAQPARTGSLLPSPARRIGDYELRGLLGVGGMGEVYRAHDSRLHREVAIKVLPQDFAADPARVSRFEREARLLASLNHPNIATIHGIERVGTAPAIVLELVAGETLAERIARGPLRVPDALAIAQQIASALDSAHETGIVHRDLKPANIKITPDGTVKLLDFGLAKAGMGAFNPIGDSVETVVSGLTREGLIVGTPAYMSPEQARGLKVDKRTDIWAFGCVLYEMLTGHAAFRGETLSDTIARILESEPDWTALPVIPPAVRGLLVRCLEKDLKRRLRDVADARYDLEAAPDSRTETAVPRGRHIRSWAIVAGIVVAIGAAGAMWAVLLQRRTVLSTAGVSRLTLALPQDEPLGITPPALSGFAVASDGRQFVYVSASPPRNLVVHSLETGQSRVLAGSGAARDPFFSPDGQWLGFFSGGRLKKVALAGGAAQDVADAPNPRGGAWGRDGTIVFTPLNDAGLFQVPANGGTPPRALTTPDSSRGEFSHRWPYFLPDGTVLFAVNYNAAAFDDARIFAYSPTAGVRQVLDRGTYPRYVASGHLVVATGGSLSAVRFNPVTMQTAGTLTPVLDNVVEDFTSGHSSFDVSPSGMLLHLTGGLQGNNRTLIWVDRQGHVSPIAAPARAYERMSLAPDGQHIAVTISGRNQGLWVLDLIRQTMARLTTTGSSTYPLWSPDGSTVAFDVMRAGTRRLFSRSWDASEEEAPLTTTDGVSVPDSWDPAGRVLVFSRRNASTGWDLFTVHRDATSRPTPILQSSFDEDAGMLSPDGRWIAFVSNETGGPQVYLSSFPDLHGKRLISTSGGREPVWSRDGRELFYRTGPGDRVMMTVPVETKPTLLIGAPQALFEADFQTRPASSHAVFDVAGDGKHFLMVQDDIRVRSTDRAEIVMNWGEELTRRVP